MKSENDATLVVISYHMGDDFSIAACQKRSQFYGASGTPNMVFDGGEKVVGGGGYTMYAYYKSAFNRRKNIVNPVDIALANETANSVRATVVNTSTQVVTGKIHFALIERNKMYSWEGMNHLDFICRAMLPDYNGGTITLQPGGSASFTRTFTIADTWNWDQCKMVVFVQSSTNKEILQGAEINLPRAVPEITVTEPAGGEVWQAGSVHTIEWNWTLQVGNVSLAYSVDGGATWLPIATGVPNTGSYPWAVPGEIFSTNCRIQVSEADGIPFAANSVPFAVIRPIDLNGDGHQDEEDRLLFAEYLADTSGQLPPADFNGDGVTDLRDLMFLSYLLETREYFWLKETE